MGTIGYGYGSEWHLLRYLGYHREELNRRAATAIRATQIEWLDFSFSGVNEPLKHDREWRAVEFIGDRNVQNAWREFWPTSGNSQNWDAIGCVCIAGRDQWLLVEAKAHVEEMRSACGAKDAGSQEKIKTALESTRQNFNAAQPIGNWLDGYYQHANRLAVLHFLNNECRPTIPARLLNVYFFGHSGHKESVMCPKDEAEWEPHLKAVRAHLGINTQSGLYQRVHSLFLPVSG